MALNHFLKFTAMKKIFALLVSMGTLTYAFAQPGYNHKNDNGRPGVYASRHDGPGRNDRRGNDAYYHFTPKERDREIARVNRLYDDRIDAVKHKFFLFPGERMKQIRNLKNSRDSEIRLIMDRYHHWRNKGNDKRGRW